MGTLQLLRTEVALHWAASALYLFSSVFFVDRAVSGRRKGPDVALWLAIAGLAVHTAGAVVRWYAVGHGPYLQKGESMSSIAWLTMAVYAFVAFRIPRLRGTGVVVLPVCVLVMLVGLVHSPWLGAFIGLALEHGRIDIELGNYARDGVMKLPPTYQGWWFIIHVTSTIAAVGAILISLSTSVLYLLKAWSPDGEFAEKLPSLAIMDDYSSKFIGLALVLWTIMIVTGSIWAERVWGSYWQWDSIQIWSVIMWLLMGLYLHLRRFFRWYGTRSSWLLITGVAVSVVTLFAIPALTSTPMFPG